MSQGDLEQISREGAADAKKAADDAARAIQDADQALLAALSQRRDDSQRKITSAADTEGVRDDIRRQNEFQALLKQQIAKVRDRIKDEKARKDVLRVLRLALIDSRAEEKKLQQEQAQSAIEQRSQSLELDIELADINENDKRAIALRLRRIAQLKKEAKLLKLTGNALKENRNERARIRKEIEAIREEDKKGAEAEEQGRTAQQVLFEASRSSRALRPTCSATSSRPTPPQGWWGARQLLRSRQ